MFRKKSEPPVNITIPYEAFHSLMLTIDILTLRLDGVERFMGMGDGDFDKVLKFMEDEGILSIDEKKQIRH